MLVALRLLGFFGIASVAAAAKKPPSEYTRRYETAPAPMGYPGSSRIESDSIEEIFPTGYEPGVHGKYQVYPGSFLGSASCHYITPVNETTCELPLQDEESLTACLTMTYNSDCVGSAREVVGRVRQINWLVPPQFVVLQVAKILREAWGKTPYGTARLGFAPSPAFYSPAWGSEFQMINCSLPEVSSDEACVLCVLNKTQEDCQLVFKALAPPLFGDKEQHYWAMPPGFILSGKSLGQSNALEYSPRKEDHATASSAAYEGTQASRSPIWGFESGSLFFAVPMLF
eukprot:g61883.t1